MPNYAVLISLYFSIHAYVNTYRSDHVVLIQAHFHHHFIITGQVVVKDDGVIRADGEVDLVVNKPTKRCYIGNYICVFSFLINLDLI